MENRIGLGDLGEKEPKAMTTFNIELRGRGTSQDAISVLNARCRDSGKSLKPKCQARWDREVEIFEQQGLIGSLVELGQLADDLHDAGHRLQVVGSAASSMVLHAMGLSPLCPMEHGFHLERFIDPEGAVGQKLEIAGLVSMTGLELLKFLWKQSYTTRVFQHETKVNGELQKLEHIGARHEEKHREGPRLILQIVTPSNLAIANLLSPGQIENCLHDPSTWELLGRGDTSGIANLEDASIQKMLRERKPESLAELAAVMIGQGPREQDGEPIEYQEDLMFQIHRDTGLPLREAYEFIRHAARNNPDQLGVATENLMRQAQSSGIEEGVAIPTLNAIQAKRRYALCKAHIFTTAHLALQTAFVKAHRPEEFQAVTSALRNESLL